MSSGGRSAPEPAVDAAFDRLVEEGDERLSRPLLPLVGTGLLGGIDVGTGVLAYFVVQHYTHNPLLAGIAFSIGFVALLLARSELFTENFLVPVVNVAAGHRNIWALLRLWSITLVANLLGGWAIAWLIVTGRPDLKETAVLVSDHYFELGINLHSFVLAVLAGTVMTLMTRMQHASDNLGVQLVPACFSVPCWPVGSCFTRCSTRCSYSPACTPVHASAIWTGLARWAGRPWATSSAGWSW